MSLRERINQDLKDAMKSKDEVRLRAVRAIRTEMLKKEKEKAGTVVNDEQILTLIQMLVKQRNDSIEMFNKGGREEMAAAEQAELEILRGYQPAALSAEEIEVIVKEVIAETGASSQQDLGKVMGPAMARCKQTGKTIDGKLVNQKVRECLQ